MLFRRYGPDDGADLVGVFQAGAIEHGLHLARGAAQRLADEGPQVLRRKECPGGKLDGGLGRLGKPRDADAGDALEGGFSPQPLHGPAIAGVVDAKAVAEPVLRFPTGEGPGGLHFVAFGVADQKVGLVFHGPPVAGRREAVDHGAFGADDPGTRGGRTQGHAVKRPVRHEFPGPRLGRQQAEHNHHPPRRRSHCPSRHGYRPVR